MGLTSDKCGHQLKTGKSKTILTLAVSGGGGVSAVLFLPAATEPKYK